MKTDNTRYKTQKWYANEHEEAVLVSHCTANDITKSEFVRRLVMQALHPRRHRIKPVRQREGPRLGLDMLFPGRRGGAPIPLRL